MKWMNNILLLVIGINVGLWLFVYFYDKISSTESVMYFLLIVLSLLIWLILSIHHGSNKDA